MCVCMPVGVSMCVCDVFVTDVCVCDVRAGVCVACVGVGVRVCVCVCDFVGVRGCCARGCAGG